MNAQGGAVDNTKVFIVGCARSGTTWTRAILAEHPAVVSGHESHLFDVLYDALRAPGRRTQWRASVLRRFDHRAAVGRAEFGDTGPYKWVDRETLERLLDDAIDAKLEGDPAAREVMEGVLDAFYLRKGGRPGGVLVEKTPRHLFYAPQILSWWPEARIVELVRDGRDVCVSFEHKSRFEAWAPAEREPQIRRWVKDVRKGMELRADPSAAGRWLTVRYEDLAGHGIHEVSRLYDFIGLSHDGDAIDRVVEATAIENARQPGNEHHIRKGVVGDWHNHFSDDDRRLFDDLAGDLMTTLGYER